MYYIREQARQLSQQTGKSYPCLFAEDCSRKFRVSGEEQIDTAITTRRRFSGQRVIACLNLRGGGMEPIFEGGVSLVSLTFYLVQPSG